MATSIIVTAYALFLMICLHGAYSQIAKMEVQSNVGILDKMQPTIAQVSKSLAAAANEGEELEILLKDAITKDLNMALDKLFHLTNGTENDFCCQCNRCFQYRNLCGMSCCTNGDLGCKCNSCSTGEMQNQENVNKVDESLTTPAVEQWMKSAKEELRSDVTRLLGESSSSNGRCCICVICKKTTKGCFLPNCCVSGGKICKCIKCSSGKVDLIADSISNPISLTAEAEAALDQVDSLVDSLFVFYKFP